MAIKDDFLDAMSGVISSVSIVTTDGKAGPAGATISAMSSVSADGDAPTMLICLHHETSAAKAILQNECFCINVLNHDQSNIADTFAGRNLAPGDNKFDCASFQTGDTGSAQLDQARANFDCRLQSAQQVGTHFVMIGEVVRVTNGIGAPLLYGNRRYTRAD